MAGLQATRSSGLALPRCTSTPSSPVCPHCLWRCNISSMSTHSTRTLTLPLASAFFGQSFASPTLLRPPKKWTAQKYGMLVSASGSTAGRSGSGSRPCLLISTASGSCCHCLPGLRRSALDSSFASFAPFSSSSSSYFFALLLLRGPVLLRLRPFFLLLLLLRLLCPAPLESGIPPPPPLSPSFP